MDGFLYLYVFILAAFTGLPSTVTPMVSSLSFARCSSKVSLNGRTV